MLAQVTYQVEQRCAYKDTVVANPGSLMFFKPPRSLISSTKPRKWTRFGGKVA